MILLVVVLDLVYKYKVKGYILLNLVDINVHVCLCIVMLFQADTVKVWLPELKWLEQQHGYLKLQLFE